jgi:hypothetical protein
LELPVGQASIHDRRNLIILFFFKEDLTQAQAIQLRIRRLFK